MSVLSRLYPMKRLSINKRPADFFFVPGANTESVFPGSDIGRWIHSLNSVKLNTAVSTTWHFSQNNVLATYSHEFKRIVRHCATADFLSPDRQNTGD